MFCPLLNPLMRDGATLDVRIARVCFRRTSCSAKPTVLQFSQDVRAANPDVDTFFGDTPHAVEACV